jgi:hypothetical protein
LIRKSKPATRQGALTVILDVKQGESDALLQLLTAIGIDIEHNPTLQFRRSPRTHFARFVLLDDRNQGQPNAPADYSRLLFTSNYDGSEDTYLQELSSVLSGGLQSVFRHCVDCPAASASARDLTAFLKARNQPSQTFYVAFPGRTVQDIARAARTRSWFEAALDKLSVELQSPARGTTIQLPQDQSESSPSGTPEELSFLERLFEWSIGLRQVRTQPKATRIDRALTAIEDKPNVVQNQITVIVNVKPSLWSRLALRLVLFGANRSVQNANGSLSDITTIHFARWALIDRGSKLLFESNYDGSWERYIDDFVDRASFGLNAIWGNTVEFLVGGSRDIEAFKKSIRDNQTPAQVFYSAYPQSTVVNIFNDLHCAENVNGIVQEIAAGAIVYPK